VTLGVLLMTERNEIFDSDNAPNLCGDLDIRIDRSGVWFHEGRPINRISLVKLFSSVLQRDKHGQYWLVTPAEQVRIQVDDAPFVVINMQASGAGDKQVIELETNLSDKVVVSSDNPIIFKNRNDSELSPYLIMRNGHEALILRQVWYELAEYFIEISGEGKKTSGVWSSGIFFSYKPKESDLIAR